MAITVEPIYKAPFTSVLELLESRVQELPDLEIFGVPDANFAYRRFTLAQLDAASSRLARHYCSSGLIPQRTRGDATTRVIAMLAPSSFEYAVSEIALLKMGHCIMFLSVNNSVPALAHLLKTAGATHLLVHPSYRTPGQEAIVNVLNEVGHVVEMVDQADSSIWQSATPQEPPFPRLLTTAEEEDLPAFIVHSSGSTGFPKPIFITHRASCHNFSCNFNVKGFITLPLFHAHGHACFWRSVHCKKILYMYPPQLPLTTESVVRALAAAPDVEGFYAVPYLIKLLAESDIGLQALKSMQLVTYGGAACPDELGDKLVREHDVRLVGHYGSTETGQLMCSYRDFETDKAWNYLRSHGPMAYGVSNSLQLKPQSTGLFELIVKPGWPAKILSNLDDGSYTTKDLFCFHETIPNAMKYVGRLDDTIMLVNGEKVNPVPTELAVKGSSIYVAEAVVFGSGKAQVGMLLLPTEAGADKTPHELFALVWPEIEKANAAAPSHGKILPEMVVVLPHDAILPRTDKGSWVRPKTYLAFQQVILDTYERFDDGEAEFGGTGTSVAKRKITGAELTVLIAEIVEGSVGSRVGVDEDLFTAGVDSLQGARIRTILQKTLDLNGMKLPINVVYEKPSIQKLATFLESVQAGEKSATVKDYDAEQIAIMHQLLDKYRHFTSRKIAPAAQNGSAHGGECVILTGATGSLGAHLLDQLLQRSDISEVYCFVRATDDAQALERVQASLLTRGLPDLSSRRFQGQKVSAWVADPGSDQFGLTKERYEALSAKTTLIFHNAWAVNFTLGVESFEAHHIRAAYNFLNLTLASGASRPTRFYFSSSVSSVAAAPPPLVAETFSTSASDAQGMGYARSKWVVEVSQELIVPPPFLTNGVLRQSMCSAARDLGATAEVLRIGQMSGDSIHGVWNESEAISLMIKSSQTIGCLPDLSDNLSWLPVDSAAHIILDVVYPSEVRHTTGVWHVINPDTCTWSAVHAGLRDAGVDFEVVPTMDWLNALRASTHDAKVNPTRKLLGFFESKYDVPPTTVARASLATTEVFEASKTMQHLPAVQSLVSKYVEAWRRSGFMV